MCGIIGYIGNKSAHKILINDQFVGELKGLKFIIALTSKTLDTDIKSIKKAARKGVGEELEKRVSLIIQNSEIQLDQRCKIIWKNNVIARLKKGNNYLNPEIEVVADDALNDIKISRFLNQNTEAPGYRQRGIKIITSAANYGTDLKISDSQSGFRAYSNRAINAIHPTEEDMSVSTEILFKISNKGLSLAEVPIAVSYVGDTSEHNPVSHGVSVLANTIKFASIKHPLQFYGIPGIVLIAIGVILGGLFLLIYSTTAIVPNSSCPVTESE